VHIRFCHGARIRKRGRDEPSQRKWRADRLTEGWLDIKILDAVQITDWLRDLPGIGKWLLKKMGLVSRATGFSTPAEHWQNLQLGNVQGEPVLPAKLFLIGRQQAVIELDRLFNGETRQLLLRIESQLDVEDFVAAYVESQPEERRRIIANKVLFVSDPDAWLSMANLRTAHILVAHPTLDLEYSGEQLHLAAAGRGHSVVIPVSSSYGGSGSVLPLRSPSAAVVESTLIEAGYKTDRARQLAEAGALSLASLKRHLRGLGDVPPYAAWSTARFLAEADLIGRWLGESPGDREAVEKLVGKSYGEWIETARTVMLQTDTPLTQRDENWKIISRGEAWSALGPHVTNGDLERFKSVAIAVLGEKDPKFDLAPEDRYLANVQGKIRKYSPALRKGLADTLALIGSRPKSLTSVSTGKAVTVAILVVRELLKEKNWKAWASLDSHVPMLAEAAPDEFLDAVESALSDPPNSVFKRLFEQERSGLTGANYMTGLLWALETLAWDSTYLLRVTMILADLASIDPGGNWSNRPSASLTDIFLPWFPQTAAPISKRVNTIEALLREYPTVGWDVLMTLLPNAKTVTSGTRKPTWNELIPKDWSDRQTNRDYWTQVAGYADLAVKTAAADLDKLSHLIERLPDLPEPALVRVLDHLASDQIAGLSESNRLSIWEALVDLAGKHRKFPDAQWSMSADEITKIEQTAAILAPKSPELLHRRLFSERDFDLFEETGNYEEQLASLNTKRQAAISAIVQKSGVNGVVQFATSVAAPRQVGDALGAMDADSGDAIVLAQYESQPEFVAGFIRSRFARSGWNWVHAQHPERWFPPQIAWFLSNLPFNRDTWRRANQLLGADESLYWSQVRGNPFEAGDAIEEAAEYLLKYKRPRAALHCLDRLTHENRPISPELAIRALTESISSDEPVYTLDQYASLHLIKYLQNHPRVDQNALFGIEWSYLRLLDRRLGIAPNTLERRLASDPNFFCELIRAVFKSTHKASQSQTPTEAQQKIAENGYRLLREWQTPPGTTTDGGFDEVAFNEWLKAVRQSCSTSGHLAVALTQVGHVLAHAPKDVDGLWIHPAAAKALNARDANDMRAGFTCELFNVRGAHWGDEGKSEHKLAEVYHGRADALEERGLHRIATAIRELAVSYEKDAERFAARDPFDFVG
jgi:hypothetical protein